MIYDGPQYHAPTYGHQRQYPSNVKIFDSAKKLTKTQAMTLNAASGIWSFSGDMRLDRPYYRYELKVYHPISKKIKTLESTDPYPSNVSTNGRYCLFIHSSDADLQPPRRDRHTGNDC